MRDRSKAIDYWRWTKAGVFGGGEVGKAQAWLHERWGPQSTVAQLHAKAAHSAVVRAGVSAVGTDDLTDPLLTSSSEFFALGYDLSIIGVIPHARRVRANVPLMRMNAGATAAWVEQRSPIPVSRPAITGSALAPLMVAALQPWSKEVLAASDTLSEARQIEDATRPIARTLDIALLDPTNAGGPDRPASPLYAVSPVASTGDFTQDLTLLTEDFPGDLKTAVLLTDTVVGTQLATKFPNWDLGPRGGVSAGYSLLTSSHGPRDTSGGQLVLLDAAAFAVVLEGGEVGISGQTSLVMSDDPANEGAPQRVSLFQNDLVALKVLMRANWELQRPTAIRYLTGVDYSEQ